MFAPKAAVRVLVVAVVAAASGMLAACSNPFAPSTARPPGGEELPPALVATTPEIAMDNLARAFNERDKELYETILDEDFWFTETDCRGDLVFANGFEQELEIMGGARDGSSQGIFAEFRTIEWDFQLTLRETEFAGSRPGPLPDGHLDEDWEVFRGRVEILLLETRDDGFRVTQTMIIKLRQGDDGLWRIIRWIDDPLSGDCGDIGEETDKPVASTHHPLTWSQLKTR